MSAAGPLTLPERPEGLPPRPVRRGKPWRALLAIPIGIVAVIAGGITYAVVSVIRSALTSPPAHHAGLVGVALHGTPPLLVTASTLAQDLVLVGGVVLAAASAMKATGRLRPADLGLRPARIASSAGLVVAGFVTFLLLAQVWASALNITAHENVPVELGSRDSAGALVGSALLVTLVAPIAEELFFRGYLFAALRRYGLVPATLVTGVAFGAAHVFSAPIAFIVPLAALGVILCLLYERTGSLYPCIALHVLNNSLAFGVGDGRGWLVPVCLAVAAMSVYGLSRSVRSFA